MGMGTWGEGEKGFSFFPPGPCTPHPPSNSNIYEQLVVLPSKLLSTLKHFYVALRIFQIYSPSSFSPY